MINPNGKLINGKVVGGIEWLKTVLPDGTERIGYTINPSSGCFHDCRWIMPDDKVATCYAKDIAEGLAQSAYPHGFEHHYWHEKRLSSLYQRLARYDPSRFFLDSMGDLFGRWVTDKQITSVMLQTAFAQKHTFLCLTKNPSRLQKFSYPNNWHIGFSTPPDFLNGHDLTIAQKVTWLHRALDFIAKTDAKVKWLSAEPLSFYVADILAQHKPLDWIVIGAASNGREKYQPNPNHVQGLLDYADANHIPVFFKGNLSWLPRREEFPQ